MILIIVELLINFWKFILPFGTVFVPTHSDAQFIKASTIFSYQKKTDFPAVADSLQLATAQDAKGIFVYKNGGWLPLYDSAGSAQYVINTVSTAVQSSVVKVNATTQQCDTNRTYLNLGASLCTYTAPASPAIVNNQSFVINNAGGVFSIIPNAGQTFIQGNNTLTALTSANNTGNTIFFRYVKTDTWLVTSMQGQFTSNTTKIFNAIGNANLTIPNMTVSNAVATEVYRDTIFANSLKKIYRVEPHFSITAPAASAGTFEVKVFFGNDSVSAVSSSIAVGQITNSMFKLILDLVPTGFNTQLISVDVSQPQGAVIALNPNAVSPIKNLSQNTGIDNILRVIVTLSNTLGTTKVRPDYFYREPF